jgi:hypothetical protein
MPSSSVTIGLVGARTDCHRVVRPRRARGDVMAGIAATVAEAALLGRRVVGVKAEARWAKLATANLDLARLSIATGWRGDLHHR